MGKHTILFLALAAAVSAPTQAAEHDRDAQMQSAGHALAEALTPGVVRKVDKAAGKVTIKHEELKNLGMPPMTMVFRVKEAAWLDQLKPGDRIRFVAERVGGAFTVMRYEPAN